MSEIPEDVMRRAGKVLDQVQDCAELGGDEEYEYICWKWQLAQDIIARALMEERERCAKIAEGNDHFPTEGEFIASLIRGTDAPSG